MASRGSMKVRRVVLLKRKCSPASPARTNSALEAVSKQLATPKQARWSAKSWYCSGCGMRGSIHARPASAAASSHRPIIFLSGGSCIGEFLIDGEIAGGEAAEAHLADRTELLQRRFDGFNRDPGGRFHRIAVDAGADARERNGMRAVIGGKPQQIAVAGSQQLRLALRTAAPHRPDRVDHESRRQAIAFGELRLARLAAAQQAAFLQQLRAGGAVDRPVHAPAAEQRGVGGIDDRIDLKRGDVALHHAKYV